MWAVPGRRVGLFLDRVNRDRRPDVVVGER